MEGIVVSRIKCAKECWEEEQENKQSSMKTNCITTKEDIKQPSADISHRYDNFVPENIWEEKERKRMAAPKNGYEKLYHNTLNILIETNPNPAILYLFFRANVAIYKEHNNNLNLYKEYYLNQNKIVCSFSQVFLEEKFNIARATPRAWVKKLEKDGLVKTISVVVNHRYKKYNIYELGIVKKVNGKTEHVFYGE